MHRHLAAGPAAAEKAAIVAAVREHVWPLIEAGGSGRSSTGLPLAEAAEAHRVVEESGHVGKVLLLP